LCRSFRISTFATSPGLSPAKLGGTYRAEDLHHSGSFCIFHSRPYLGASSLLIYCPPFHPAAGCLVRAFGALFISSSFEPSPGGLVSYVVPTSHSSFHRWFPGTYTNFPPSRKIFFRVFPSVFRGFLRVSSVVDLTSSFNPTIL
jgi:hypothetical protein